MKNFFILCLSIFLAISTTEMQGQEASDTHQVQGKENQNENIFKIDRTMGMFEFTSAETGWNESITIPGAMYAEVRLLIKNISGKAIRDLPYISSLLKFRFLENGIITYESQRTIHDENIPAWDSGLSKYIILSSGRYRNFTDKYKEKILYVEVFYNDTFIWKGKIQNTITNWDY